MPDEFSASDFGGQAQEFSADDFAPKKPSVAAPELGIGQGVTQFAGSLAKGLAAVSEFSRPVMQAGISPEMPFGIPGAPAPEEKRTLPQIMGDIRQNPAFKAGQALEGAIKLTPQEEASWWTRRGRDVGGFAPALLGPLAPAAFGVEALGNHIDNDYQQAKKEGLSEEDAARRAMDKGLASGAFQAATFAVLPPALKGAAEKYLIGKFGKDTFARFLAGRIGLGAEGATVGATSTAGENVISGRPLAEGVGGAALGLGAVSALMPPYMLPKRGEAPAEEPIPRPVAGLLRDKPIEMGPGVRNLGEIEQQLKEAPARPNVRTPDEIDRLQAQKREAQPAPAIIGEEAPQSQADVIPAGEGSVINFARRAVQRARVDQLQREFEQAAKQGDAAKMQAHQAEMLDLVRQLQEVPHGTPLEEQGAGLPGSQFPPTSKAGLEPATAERPVAPELAGTTPVPGEIGPRGPGVIPQSPSLLEMRDEPVAPGSKEATWPPSKRPKVLGLQSAEGLPAAIQPPEAPLKSAAQIRQERIRRLNREAGEAANKQEGVDLSMLDPEKQAELRFFARKEAQGIELNKGPKISKAEMLADPEIKKAYDQLLEKTKEEVRAEGAPEPSPERLVVPPVPEGMFETKKGGKKLYKPKGPEKPVLQENMPEFRQKILSDLDKKLDQLHKKATAGKLPKKKDLHPIFKDVQELAGKLGIQVENMPPEFDLLDYVSVVRQIDATLKKSFPKKGIISGSAAEKWADDTLKGGGTHGGTDVLAAYAIKGAAILERGVRQFSDWIKEFLRNHPELKGQDEKLRDIYRHAVEINKTTEASKSVDKIVRSFEYQPKSVDQVVSEIAKEGAEHASGKQETAEVHGDVRPQPGQGAREVPVEEGGGGVQPQAQHGLQEEGQAGRDVSLKPPEEGKVRVYQGSSGSSAGSSFFTTDINRAASYGENVQYVDVTPEEFASGRKQAQASGQPSSSDTMLPNEVVKRAQKYPGKVEGKVHDLEAPIGPDLRESVAKKAIDTFDKMEPDQFMKLASTPGRNLTSLAYNLARMVRKEGIPDLQSALDKANTEYKQHIKAADESENAQERIDAINKSGPAAWKSQFFSEALKFRKALDAAIESKASTLKDFEALERKFGVGANTGVELQKAAISERGKFSGEQPEFLGGEKMYAGLAPAFEVLDKFYEKDLKPALKGGAEVAGALAKGIINVFSPATRASSEGVDTLFRSKGEKEKFISKVSGFLNAQGQIFHNMTNQQRLDFVDRIKRGQKQPNKGLQQAADGMRRWDDSLYDEIVKYKPDLPYLENHLRVLWKTIPGSPEAFKGMLDQLPLPQRNDFFTRFQKGQAQPTADLQKIADAFKGWDLNQAEIEALKRGRGLSESQLMSKRPWRGSQGFAKRHVLDDMSEGIALGGVPVTTDPFRMFMMSVEDGMKFVAANRAWDGLKKLGKVKFVQRGQRPPEGYQRIEDSIAKAYFRTPEGLQTSTGEWWVDGGEARMINNYLSRDMIRNNPVGRAALAVKNISTAVELGLSPFHAVFETNEVMGSRMALGLRQILHGDRPIEGLRNVAEGLLVEPITALQEAHFLQPLVRRLGIRPHRGSTVALGEAAIRYARNAAEFKAADPDTYNWFVKNYPSAHELIDLLFTGGGQLEMHQDYRYKAQAGLREAMKEGNYAGAILRLLPAANDFAMKPLFETYIPRLKVGTFLREFSFELERNSDKIAKGEVTRDALARKSWAFVEDRFGELNWDNLFWNRTFKSSMQLLFRSVTWKLGNVRGFGKAGRDIATETAEAGKYVANLLGIDRFGKGRKPELTMPMAWVLGITAVTGMQAAIITKVSTGKYPWELAKTPYDLYRNLVFPRIDPQDESQRVSIPTYWRDLVHATHDWGKGLPNYIRTSMTGEIGRLMDVWDNKDFYGVEVYHPDDPEYKKVYDAVKHLIPLPFGFSSYVAAHQTGATGARAAAGFMGFTKAPYYVSYTPAEKMAFDLIRNQMPIGSRTKEEFQRGVNERIAVDSMKRGEMTMKDARDKGLVSRERVDRVRRREHETPLQHAVNSLHAADSVKILAQSNPEERKQIAMMVKRKILNSTLLTPKQKHEYMAQVRAILGDQRRIPASTTQLEYAPTP
jgi:hypothetical protein